MKILIKPDGDSVFIYDDKLRELLDESGGSHTFRASHVEPAQDGSWLADLRNVNGPVLTGFRLRSEALAAEVAWITENIIDSSESLKGMAETEAMYEKEANE